MDQFIPAGDRPTIDDFAELTRSWSTVPNLFRRSEKPLPQPWDEIFGPLRHGSCDELMVVAQMGQSIDGRIATDGGRGEFINGPPGLDHLHRLRALVDAVVVGVGTAVADNPRLTVRRVAGPQPARVVIDPRGRLPAAARLLTDDGTRRIVVTGADVERPFFPDIEVIRVVLDNGRAQPREILAALRGAGLRRMLIEGGTQTVSGFLAAGCLDRLHIVVAPLLLGSGQSSLTLPPIDCAGDGLRPPVRAHLLEDEVLFDVDLSAQRVAVGRASTSR
jgi:diaminohydroxyphosphoribosylaminopyrimidine deaminase/5-amino-6-(5-phosphoribosylamino)uracil reductase